MSRRTLGAARPLDEVEKKAFDCYAWNHYMQALHTARNLAMVWAESDAQFIAAIPALIEKLASPYVYLREAWDCLPADEKARYSPELAERVKEAARAAEQLWASRKAAKGAVPP
jgi:hypothetical protein